MNDGNPLFMVNAVDYLVTEKLLAVRRVPNCKQARSRTQLVARKGYGR
jgi:hypothetical protein